MESWDVWAGAFILLRGWDWNDTFLIPRDAVFTISSVLYWRECGATEQEKEIHLSQKQTSKYFVFYQLILIFIFAWVERQGRSPLSRLRPHSLVPPLVLTLVVTITVGCWNFIQMWCMFNFRHLLPFSIQNVVQEGASRRSLMALLVDVLKVLAISRSIRSIRSLQCIQ